ncbi:Putative Immunoglobulin-like domain-containing protein [Septoria linicola]|uniref:Immunoglobulin-like domain-containing protein n=1 Tax=Septoria linicola TaxID=215465 RepID=A0A9Q9AUY2_9PEZI|nr:putative Immunoglobulin-like domain-containing protein [Septoria linicola]USW52452.1 Putative Immunoglobulin-like domain-containing protein [Septoria linicola]
MDPVVGLLHSFQQQIVEIESRFPPLRRQIRDLRTNSLGSSAKALIGRTDLVDGLYKKDRHLKAKQKVVYWQIDRTFERLWYNAEDAVLNVYCQIDQVKKDRQSIRDKIEDLEDEIAREKLPTGCSPIPRNEVARKRTGFLDLPAELRNAIYRLSDCLELSHRYNRPIRRCLCGWLHPDEDFCPHFGLETIGWRDIHISGVIEIPTPPGHRYYVDAASIEQGTHAAIWRQPSVTRVNKQIRSETLPMFYGNLQVTLRCASEDISESQDLKWLRQIGKANAGLLNSLLVQDSWGMHEEDFRQRCQKALADLGVVIEREGIRASISWA